MDNSDSWGYVEVKVKPIRDRLKSTQHRQKIYIESWRRYLVFKLGDQVFLKISPLMGIIRFRCRGKLNPWYIRQFPIIERIILFAYRLELTSELEKIHNIFNFPCWRIMCPTCHTHLKPLLWSCEKTWVLKYNQWRFLIIREETTLEDNPHDPSTLEEWLYARDITWKAETIV